MQAKGSTQNLDNANRPQIYKLETMWYSVTQFITAFMISTHRSGHLLPSYSDNHGIPSKCEEIHCEQQNSMVDILKYVFR